MPAPLDPRKRPTSVKVHVTSGAGVDVEWSDSHLSHYDFEYLRENCPCASCSDERRKSAAQSGSSIRTSMTPLPMFKPKPKARAAAPVGNYAIQIEFTDGHTTGIYSFAYLREICPCDACARAFRSGS